MRCSDLDQMAVPFVDGEAPRADCAEVEAHLKACPPCRERIDAERAARDALQADRVHLLEHAPAELRARCRGLCHVRRRWLPVSLVAAAALVALVLWVGTTDAGTPVLAAQLTLDHVKCFKFGSSRVNGSPADLAVYWRERYGWPIAVPAGAGAGLHLSGVRRCGSSDGQTAHIMYTYNSRPLSLFVARNGGHPRTARELSVFGDQTLVWSAGERTYVLVGEEPRAQMELLAAEIRKEVPAE